jgi:hypothetical protein
MPESPLVTWRMPAWGSLLGLGISLALSLGASVFLANLLAASWEMIAADGAVGLVLAVPALVNFACMLALASEIGLLAGATLVRGVRTAGPHASLDLDSFYHVQLARPVRLDRVRSLKVHRLRGTPGALTLVAEEPLALRFASPFNVRRLLRRPDADRTFTCLLPAGSNPVLTGLIRAVRLHGGRVIGG